MAGSDSQRVELKAVQGAELEGRGGDGRLRLAAGGAEGGAGSRVRGEGRGWQAPTRSGWS